MALLLLPVSILGQTYYSDQLKPREWAEKKYMVVDDASPSDLVLIGEVPKLVVEEVPSKIVEGGTDVEFKFTPTEHYINRKKLDAQCVGGDLIEAKGNRVELEKGLIIELIGIALIDRGEPGEGKEPIVWRNPISGEILSTEDLKGLPKESVFYWEGRQIATAVRVVGLSMIPSHVSG